MIPNPQTSIHDHIPFLQINSSFIQNLFPWFIVSIFFLMVLKCCFGVGQISQRVFELMKSECVGDASISAGLLISGLDALKMCPPGENRHGTKRFSEKPSKGNHLVLEIDNKSKSQPFESYKKRTTIVVKRKTFLDVVCEALAEYKYVGPNQRADLVLACR